jgi:hypothetical protein
MTFGVKTAILWLVTIAVACAVSWLLRRPRTAETATQTDVASKAVGIALCVLGVALVSVGIVSNTIRPHIIQMLPAAGALAMCTLSEPLGMATVRAICSFWLVTMTAIWLFLLGWTGFLTGTFSPVEVALTFIIGTASLVGLLKSRELERLSPWSEFLTIVVSSAVQAGALWLSYQPIIVGR